MWLPPSAVDRTRLAAAVILLAVALIGFAGADATRLDDGTATVEMVSPTPDRLAVDDGRFGTAAQYLRIPDLRVEVAAVEGTPRLQYRIVVPALDVDRRQSSLLHVEGRRTLHLDDVAFPPGRLPTSTDAEFVTGRLLVKVQSFSTENTVLNHSFRVSR